MLTNCYKYIFEPLQLCDSRGIVENSQSGRLGRDLGELIGFEDAGELAADIRCAFYFQASSMA